jgi:hypothetical protein
MVAENDDEDADNIAIDDGGSEQKYANIKAVVAAHERIDMLWRCSKEVKFINKIIDCREEYNQNEFADHVYFYHTAKSLQRIDLKMLNVVSNEIQAELDRRREKIRLDRLEATKFERRKARLAKKRKALVERGLDPESIQLADINIDDDSDDEENKGGAGDASVHKEEGDGSGSDGNNGSGSGSDDDSNDSSSEEDDIPLPEELMEKDATPQKRRRRRGDKKEGDDIPAYLR